MKTTILLLLLSMPLLGMTQNIVKGVVKDKGGHTLPGARVSLENTTYGVATNAKGAYFLEVGNKDTVIVKYQMTGFVPFIDTLILTKSVLVNNIELSEKTTQLDAVEIYANKRDIAKEVINHVIDNKKNLRNQFETYECKTYIKTSLEKEPRFNGRNIVNNNGETFEPVGRQKMNFIESNSITKFQRKNTYREVVLAHHDYSEKSNSTVTFGAKFSSRDAILPTQVIEYNPYIFFEKVQDGDFDLYQNLIELPKVSSRPLVSPLAINAFVNYKYTLNAIFYENEQKIYEIAVEPRFKEAALFSGNLFIIDSLWVIKSMDLSVNSAAMEYFKDFRIIEDFVKVNENWVPERREFNYTINDGSNIVIGNTRVQHSNYNFEPNFDSKTFKNILLSYEEDAFDKDSSYWKDVRPIQLKKEELNFIKEQDSIEKVLTSDAYVDSVNTAYNKIKFWDIVLNGVGFRNREKKQEIYINSLISQIQLLGVGGYRHTIGGSYSKEFNNAQDIRIRGDLGYGRANRDFKGQLTVGYTFFPKHFGNLEVRGGDIYDFVTFNESLTGFFSRQNQVRKTFFGITQKYELINGLYGLFHFDYSTRRDISQLNYAPWTDQLIESGFWQQPDPFETYTVSIFQFQFLYRFKQKYILKGNKKIIVGTEFPEIGLNYKKGVPNLFRSDVDFNFLELSASDKVTLGSFGILKWRAEAGTFFGKTSDEVQFVERKFIRGSDSFFFSNPLNTLQRLDSTFNTTQPYFQAYGIHHFNGAIMSKIPLINKLKLELVAGGGVLLINEANLAHIEFYGGIERKFKIKEQLFKLGAFYTVSENNISIVDFRFKFGFDFFNSFTNEWSY